MTDSSTHGASQRNSGSENREDELEHARVQPVASNAEALPPGSDHEHVEERALHVARGALLIALGASAPFCLMAADRHFGFSVPVGALGCLIAACGVLDLFGTFDAPVQSSRAPGRAPSEIEFGRVVPRVGELLVAILVQVALLRLAVAGVLPRQVLSAAVLIPASFLWLVISFYRLGRSFGAWQADELGLERTLTQRHGFWLIAINVLLYLPLLGSFSLSDPWETHYGEVAREMLARDDWISLWWAQDGWFWSKPILDFWMQGLAFSLLAVGFMPDQMLIGASQGRFPQPEWAARMPIFLLTLLGVYLIYKGVASAFGRRAGFIGGLILTTLPYWYLLAHQTMTDMPYVAPLTAAMGLLMLGLQSDPEKEVSARTLRFGRRSVEVSGFHLLFGAVILCVLPQVLYLLTRNVTLQLDASPHGFRWHLDEFFAGSGAGNCGLPGNESCHKELPRNRAFQPWHGALLWSALTGVLLWLNRDERRTQRLYYLAAWFLMALSAMAKGAPGLVLPLFVIGIFIGATKRWRELTRLEFSSMLLMIAVIILPWYVQMFMRHGQPFTDRLLFHDMYKRAFVHVHDTNTGDDVSFRYYVWQLGYGLFPWTGLIAAGLVSWLCRNDERRDAQSGYAAFLALWFIAAFSMFTISLTKFHHYIFPAVPPMAMLAGIFLDQLIASSRAPALKLPLASVSSEDAERRYTSSLFGMLGIAAAITVALVGRDLFTTVRGDIEGQARLVHLFTYNYRRPWPDSLDFNAALKAFTAAAALGCALLCVRRWRAHVAIALCVIGVIWCAWGVNVYHVKTAPHWGQRETLLAYYARRTGPHEPFVSYQMNWKGENFYTGNRTPAFVSSGQKFKDWITEQKQRGVKVMFFTTEHGRLGSLKSELGQYRKLDVITTPELNNKFLVARVEL